jgi:hypothetical protein
MPEDRGPRNSGAQGQESGHGGKEMKSGSDSARWKASGGVGAKAPRVEKNRAIII